MTKLMNDGLSDRSTSVWSGRKVAAALFAGAWAAFFWSLIFTGNTTLFLASRTTWLAWLGAIGLSVAALGRLASARSPRHEPIDGRTAWTGVALLLPVAILTAQPPGVLGSFAAQSRASFVSQGYVSSASDIASGELSLADVAGAVRSREGMRALAGRAGDVVDFTGFVTKEPGAPADEFLLTRFLISCCVADALSVQVRVAGAPPGRFAEDDWVRVTGNIYPVGREVVLDATEVVGVPRPKRPYLNP